MSTLVDDRVGELERENAELRRLLAERTAERDEALTQQTATAEMLQVINASPGDLAPVFDAMLEKATRLCDASHGVLRTFDGELFHLAAAHGESHVVERERQRGPVRAAGGLLGATLAGEHLIHVADVRETDTWRNYPTVRERLEAGGVRSWLSVALRKEEKLLGAIIVYRQEVRPFSEEQIALLQNFAAQAVIAMENARLITETREALEQQTATAEVLQVINSSPGDLAPVFDAMLERALRLCNAGLGHVWGYDGEGLAPLAIRGGAEVGEWFRQIGRLIPSPETPVGRIVRGEDLVHIADVTKEPAYASLPLYRRYIDAGHIRTSLAVPLRQGGTLSGIFAVYRQEVQPFTEKQIALLQNFAAQAVIAMENARLLTETREALEQQTATAEVLGVINASPGDLTPVFEAMLEKAMRLCEAAFGSLWTLADDRFRPVAHRGLPDAYADYLSREVPAAGPGTGRARLLAGEFFAHIPDLADEEPYREGEPHRLALVDLGGARTALLVPLRKDDAVIGFIMIYRQEVRPFTEKQIVLLQNFAAQAVIAIENARLLTETREALEQQTATAEVLQVINASPGDLAPVFDAMLDKALRLCDASFGQLITSSDGEVFTIAAAKGPSSIVQFLRNRPPTRPGPGTTMSRLVGGEQCVHVIDAMAEEAYRRGDPTRRALVDLGGCRTMVSVGLRKDDALLGAITVYRSDVKPFSEKEIGLIENFAAQAVIAMENARLLGELRARTEEVAAWNRELEDRVAAQLGELERAGRLKRFLAPQLAELIVARGDENILETHRRDIVVVFCDLRGFTAFAETAEPEEVLELLREYHGALGPIVAASEGTLDHFSGDGIMVFFNDPVPVPDASERAVRMAIEMRAAMARLEAQWRRQGRAIGFGVGIARGYATLGQIGFAERVDYTAIGTVCNLAARLCAEAQDGQILISRRVAAAVEDSVRLEEVGDLALKGLMQAVAVYNVAAEPWLGA